MGKRKAVILDSPTENVHPGNLTSVEQQWVRSDLVRQGSYLVGSRDSKQAVKKPSSAIPGLYRVRIEFAGSTRSSETGGCFHLHCPTRYIHQGGRILTNDSGDRQYILW